MAVNALRLSARTVSLSPGLPPSTPTPSPTCTSNSTSTATPACWPAATIELRNASDTEPLIYRLKTTRPQSYLASPTTAVIAPLSSVTVTLCRRPFPPSSSPTSSSSALPPAPAADFRDKFLILSAPLSAAAPAAPAATAGARWRSVPRSACVRTEFCVVSAKQSVRDTMHLGTQAQAQTQAGRQTATAAATQVRNLLSSTQHAPPGRTRRRLLLDRATATEDRRASADDARPRRRQIATTQATSRGQRFAVCTGGRSVAVESSPGDRAVPTISLSRPPSSTPTSPSSGPSAAEATPTTRRRRLRVVLTERANFPNSSTNTNTNTDAPTSPATSHSDSQSGLLDGESRHSLPLLRTSCLRPQRRFRVRFRASRQQQATTRIAEFPAAAAHADSTCPVCLDALHGSGNAETRRRGMLTVTPCAHVMHAQCLRTWCATFGHSTCPVCRTPMAGSGRGAAVYQQHPVAAV